MNIKIKKIIPKKRQGLYCENCFEGLNDRPYVYQDDLGSIFCSPECAKKSEGYRENIKIVGIRNGERRSR